MGTWSQDLPRWWMIRERVEKLCEVIEAANDELEAIRQMCPHSQHEIGWYSWRIGSMAPAKICTACRCNLGSPSQVEINKFMEDEKAGQYKFLVETYGQEEADHVTAECPVVDHWTREIV